MFNYYLISEKPFIPNGNSNKGEQKYLQTLCG